jgi:hypothetical protein
MVASRTTSFDQCAQAVALNSRTTRATANGEHSAPAAGQTPEWLRSVLRSRFSVGKIKEHRLQSTDSESTRSTFTSRDRTPTSGFFSVLCVLCSVFCVLPNPILRRIRRIRPGGRTLRGHRACSGAGVAPRPDAGIRAPRHRRERRYCGSEYPP